MASNISSGADVEVVGVSSGRLRSDKECRAVCAGLHRKRLAEPGAPGIGRTRPPDCVRFHGTPEVAVRRAQFVQESIPERIEVKHAIYRAIEPCLLPDTIVALSASGLLAGEMQQGWQAPGRFIVAHPFNPPHLIPLVELLGNDKTAGDVLERAEAFFVRCGKITIRVCREVPVHVANRLQAALWREAIHLVMTGVASVGDVDKAVQAGPGLRWAVMGPHMLFNLGSGGSGLGTFCERYSDSFHRWWDSLGDPRLTPDVAATLVAASKKKRQAAGLHHCHGNATRRSWKRCWR